MSKIRNLVAAKYQIVALSEEMTLLEEAKKAGMQAAVQFYAKNPSTDTSAIKNAILESFGKYKEKVRKRKAYNEKTASQWFLNGFREAAETSGEEEYN